ELRKLHGVEIWHVPCEQQNLRLDWRDVWCSVSVSPLDPCVEQEQLVVIIDDISERHEYRHKLEQEARRRDDFMAMLGHELRNPLAALANATELLRRGNADPRVARISGVLERQTHQMRRMVDDLLDVARIAE